MPHEILVDYICNIGQVCVCVCVDVWFGYFIKFTFCYFLVLLFASNLMIFIQLDIWNIF